MKKLTIIILLSFVCIGLSAKTVRQFWVAKAYQMSYPVVKNLSQGTLRQNMPLEHPLSDEKGFNPKTSNLRFTHLEAVGRTLCGIAPWLECTADLSAERREILSLAHSGLRNAVDSLSPDFLNFRDRSQPLVDAAFLAQAFLRSPTQLWGGLDDVTKQNMIRELKLTRNIKPNMNNWLLFSATVEAFLCYIGEPYQVQSIEFALEKMEEWYKGDALYGDGPKLHYDYYNSYVIQPMMVDIMAVMHSKLPENPNFNSQRSAVVNARASRYAEILERSISPEGTFPVVGRSILYRTGAMQSLAQASLLGQLPKELTTGQVREALTLVIRRMLNFRDTYDKSGWLTMGFCGNAARKAGEYYLSTGSMYLASTVFLPLGLPESDQFWSSPAQSWTSKKAWSGEKFPIDESLKK